MLGTALLNRGLAGKRLAVIGENSYAWCLAFTAIVNGVGTAVPLDRLLPADEIINLLGRGEVDAVFCDAAFLPVMEQAARLLPRLQTMICLRPARLRPGGIRQVETNPAFMSLPDLLAEGEVQLAGGDRSYLDRPIDPAAMMSLLFTSGTTSTAKAVMLSHANICADVRGMAGVIKLKPGIRMLSVLPLHHTFENTCGLFMALYVGAEIHECDGLRYIQKNLQEYGIEMIIGVPLLFTNFHRKIRDALTKSGKEQMVQRLIPITQALRKVGIDLRRIVYKQILAGLGGQLRLAICGAAPIDPDIIRFFDAVGIRILQGYGLTETSPVIAGCNSRLFVPGTVGQPISGVAVAIAADTPDEPGEILVRSPIVMLGYYQDPAATAEVIDADGWLHTGDMGRLDPRTRCISITGRVKSMIVLKNGKKVFPEELEYLIEQTGLVKESLVWGEPAEDGEIIVAAKMVVDQETLQARAGRPVDEKDIRQVLDQLIKEINASLPSFKGIRHYIYSYQEMVKTTTMKIRRSIEIAKISEIMTTHQLKWREVTGQNLDHVAVDQRRGQTEKRELVEHAGE
jgi:long-chain acyl-CoA synthetase